MPQIELKYIDSETGDVKIVDVVIPAMLGSRIATKANSEMKATVKSRNNNSEIDMDDVLRKIEEVKDRVMEWLLKEWINPRLDFDLCLDDIPAREKKRIVSRYEEDLYGIKSKKKEDG